MFAGRPLTVVRYLGFDRHSQRFVEVHFERTHTDVMHSEGTLSEDGRTITSLGVHIDPATGTRVKVQSITTFGEGDTLTLELIYFNGEDEGTNRVLLAHRRRTAQ